MYSGIIPIIKRAAVDAVNSTQPVNITFGTVTSTSPLKIQITPKLVLGKANIMLCKSVTKYTVPMKLPGSTTYQSVSVDNALDKGDKVVLARVQGGNTYLVLDKAVKA